MPEWFPIESIGKSFAAGIIRVFLRKHTLKNLTMQALSSRLLFAVVMSGCIGHSVMAQGFDHRLPYDNSRIYKLQDAVPLVLGVIPVGGALYEGSETRLGNTLWQSSEAMLFSGAMAGGLKLATRRQRPTKTDDPNQWFSERGNDSFPSGHVSPQLLSRR